MGGGAMVGRMMVVLEDRYVVVGAARRREEDGDGRYAARPPARPPLRAASNVEESPNTPVLPKSSATAIEGTAKELRNKDAAINPAVKRCLMGRLSDEDGVVGVVALKLVVNPTFTKDGRGANAEHPATRRIRSVRRSTMAG